ncbi:glutamate--cysteine ligase [Agromyces marinus]|uniref:Putative glutamate--cysteine ligase 2 n=1 Tax=Agromyces marinus TaxID=1389020 RepID=A0ABN6YGN7_9MICO|nr:glutamate--cysteine ligase [Agromyces marinus]UIP58903.1 Putative glutamate--cysteine ligase 2 [Agromyces marinus]BDZ56139.1 putative glutamate--cysteine ligase 2 [Agromyces marinus]
MEIEFARSARSSVGIEWELAIVDRATGELASVGDVVLTELGGPDGSPHPWITSELLTNTVELVSGVHDRVAGAVEDLTGQVAEVRAVLDRLGEYELICSGSHPFSRWYDQRLSDKPRYHKLVERTRWWGRNMMIWGIHVHVGIEERDKALPILDAMLAYVPHLQALSASSPFWAGVETGYASNRALMFQQLPTAGLPYQFPDWASYERYVDDLVRTGVIEDHTEVRWDIRPSPRWGTIEVRVCDGVSSADEIGAIAALVHCLVEWLSTRLDEGETLPTMQPWYVRENKWRAARYGMQAEIITDTAGTERLVADEVADLLTTLAPVAERLGCPVELQRIRAMLEHGAGYERQLRVAAEHGGDLTAVVAHLARELREGTTRAQ